MISISVAMATYNGGPFLIEQLESLARQTYLPLELVVTDDQSSDDTVNILRLFKARAPFPVRIVVNDCRLGHRLNFMKCASLCQGSHIAFCDQDDIWNPEKIHYVVQYLLRYNYICAIHNATIFENDKTNGLLYPYDGQDEFDRVERNDFFFLPYGFTMTFDSRLLELSYLHPTSLDFNDTRHIEAHDQWIYFVASALGKVGFIAEPLALYRRHSRNVTQLLARKTRFDIFRENLGRVCDVKRDLWLGSQRRLEILNKITAQDYNLKTALHRYKLTESNLRHRHCVYNEKSFRDRASHLFLYIRNSFAQNLLPASQILKIIAVDFLLGVFSLNRIFGRGTNI